MYENWVHGPVGKIQLTVSRGESSFVAACVMCTPRQVNQISSSESANTLLLCVLQQKQLDLFRGTASISGRYGVKGFALDNKLVISFFCLATAGLKIQCVCLGEFWARQATFFLFSALSLMCLGISLSLSLNWVVQEHTKWSVTRFHFAKIFSVSLACHMHATPWRKKRNKIC